MNDWDDWLASQEKAAEIFPLRIRQMWLRHGKSDNKCGKCAHFLRVKFSKVYRKCSKAKMTHGPGTDWKAGWPACGLFEPGEGEVLYGKR